MRLADGDQLHQHLNSFYPASPSGIILLAEKNTRMSYQQIDRRRVHKGGGENVGPALY